MRFIPTRLHGVLDYGFVVVTAAIPYLLGAGDRGALTWATGAIALLVLIYSLATDYEVGVVRVLTMRAHLALDAVVGVALLAAALSRPGPAGFTVALAALGLFSLAASVCTRRTTGEGAGLAGPATLSGVSAMSEMPAADRAATADGRPAAPSPGSGRRPATLRAKIDSGAGGDKVAMTDPSMAPLGSDDEAGEPHDERGLATARSRSP